MNQPNHSKALYLDLELTCFEKGDDLGTGVNPDVLVPEIIQIGIVEANLINLEITREKVYYVRPKLLLITDSCTRLTGITETVLRERGRPLHEVLRTMQKEFAVKSKAVFGWGRDDLLLKTSPSDLPLIETYYDLSFLFRTSLPSIGRSNPSLIEACAFLKIPPSGRSHDALVDARDTAYVHLDLIRKIRSGVDWRDYPTTIAECEALKIKLREEDAKLPPEEAQRRNSSVGDGKSLRIIEYRPLI